MKFQSLFDEVNSVEDRVMIDAEKYYDTLLELQNENYTFTEVKNKGFFEKRHQNFNTRVDKYLRRNEELQQNYAEFQKAFESGRFISTQFIKLHVDELYKVPEHQKLPRWFEHFKEEEFEKVKSQLNEYASRLYRSRMSDSMRSDRKKLNKKIEQLLADIQERYQDPNNLPAIKINELQHYIEELQSYDRVIPEICYEVMHKASEYARAVVSAFVEFRQKSSDYIQTIV